MSNHTPANVQRVVDFLHRNLDASLRLPELGDLAGLSAFHMQRVFKAATGHSPAQRVRLLRLKRASMRLAMEPWRAVMDIALEAGYANGESFSRAFRREMRQSPREFRQYPDWSRWRALFTFPVQAHLPRLDVNIVNFPNTVVAAVEHVGSSDDIYDSTRKLVKWRRSHRVSPERHRTYCVLHDLRTQAASGYRVDICVSYEKSITANRQDVIAKVIAGGRCARVRHMGPREHIPILQPLYTEWLPRSGERLRPDPPFLHFVNMGHDIAAHELITDVYLPIES